MTEDEMLEALSARAVGTLQRAGYAATVHNDGRITYIVVRALDHPAGIIEIAYLERETSEVHVPLNRSFGVPEYLPEGFPQAVDAMCEIVVKIDRGDYRSFTKRSLFRRLDVVEVEVQDVGLHGRRSDVPFSERLGAIERL